MWYREASFEKTILEECVRLQALKKLRLRGKHYPTKKEIDDLSSWGMNWLYSEYGKELKNLNFRADTDSFMPLAIKALDNVLR